MKFDRIVGFGDSWMYGDELLDPVLAEQHADAHCCWTQNDAYRQRHCFLGELGHRYGVVTENFGFPGSSLQSTIWNALWWLRHATSTDHVLILVALTDANRMSFWNPQHQSHGVDPGWNRHVHTAWVHRSPWTVERPWRDMVKSYTALTDCPELHDLNYQQAVMFFDGMAARHGCAVLQFNVMAAPCQVQSAGLPWPHQDLVTMLRNRSDLLCVNGHPNELGHRYIADLLQKHIDDAILAG
jgi:hypothetical protein